jgi:glutamate--cysteine ligase
MLPLGINAEQIRFIDAFLLFCLYQDSPPCDDDNNAEISANLLEVVNRGREPGLQLNQNGRAHALQDWAEELIAGIDKIAAQLDTAHRSSDYRESCAKQLAKVHNAALTPSAQIVAELESGVESYYHYAMTQSQVHANDFRERGLRSTEAARFKRMQEQSVAAQATLEAEQAGEGFEDYLARFYEQYQTL